MKAVSLRLNEIIDIESDPIVEISGDDSEILLKMYLAIIDEYYYSYISYDNKEQFISRFKYYWTKYFNYYLEIFKRQTELTKNLFTARLEEYSLDREITETPELTTTSTDKLGDTVTTNYGRTLKHERNLTEDNTVTNSGSDVTNVEATRDDTVYTQPTVDVNNNSETTLQHGHVIRDDRELGGTYDNTYGGSDSVNRSGENVNTRVESGTKTYKHVDTKNNRVTLYDFNALISSISSLNVLDELIDRFSPLFMGVLF